MLNVIVAANNQIGHNMLFLKGGSRYMTCPYEIIVVDNHSTGGSAEFYDRTGVR